MWSVWEHKKFLGRGSKQVIWLGIGVRMDITTSVYCCTLNNWTGFRGRGRKGKVETAEIFAILRARTKLAKKGSTDSWRCQRKAAGQVTGLAVCTVQLIEHKHKWLDVSRATKAITSAFALHTWANAPELLVILTYFAGTGKSLHLLVLG